MLALMSLLAVAGVIFVILSAVGTDPIYALPISVFAGVFVFILIQLLAEPSDDE